MLDLLNNLYPNEFNGVDYKSIELNDKVISRWDKLGLLNGLDDDLKDKCALSYERLAAYAVNDEKECEDNTFLYAVMFPCVRYIVSILNDDIMPDEVIKKVKIWCKYDVIENLRNVINKEIDVESEIGVMVCASIVVDLIRDGKYKLDKVK